MRVIALLRGLMVAPARGSTAGPGGGRRGAKTAGATPTTGCVTPPDGVGVERRRDILLIVAPSLRNDHDLVPRAEIGGFSPRSAGAPPKRSDGARLGYRGTSTVRSRWLVSRIVTEDWVRFREN